MLTILPGIARHILVKSLLYLSNLKSKQYVLKKCTITHISIYLLDRYNLNAEECLFIDDDDSGKNYETANKIGIKGRRIMPNQAEDVKKLLLEFNVKI